MFIVCGEALFDLFSTGNTPGGLGFEGRVGGSPFNVAMGLARLGHPVAFLGGIGAGFAGDRLLQALEDEGIGTGCVARIGAPVTLSLVGIDARGVPSYAFYGEGAADRMLRLEHLVKVPPQARAFHVGSYAMVVQPAADTLRSLIDRVHVDRLVAYDPNIRLNVEPDLGAWRNTLAWMLPRTHLLKASEEDLDLLWPGRSVGDFIDQALASGTGWVVVTRGAAGAVSATAQAQVTLPAPAVHVVDTVGAGDTFQAALLSWLDTSGRLSPAGVGALDGTAQARALGFAMRAAAVTCGRRGADLPRRHELPSASEDPHGQAPSTPIQ